MWSSLYLAIKVPRAISYADRYARRCSGDVEEMWRRCGGGVVWSRYGWGVEEMWRRCGGGVEEM
jgi:hypothetical protein